MIRRKGPNLQAGARSAFVRRTQGAPAPDAARKDVRRDVGVLVVLLPDEMVALRDYWDAKARGTRLFGSAH